MGCPSPDDEIAVYYARGLERDRLSEGSGALEVLRTQVLLERHSAGRLGSQTGLRAVTFDPYARREVRWT